MINLEKNEVESIETCKPETLTAKKAPKVNVDNVIEGIVKPTDKTQNTNTEAVRPTDDCFENSERNCSACDSKQENQNLELDILIEKPMFNTENNEIDAAEIYKPETQVASKTPTVNDDNALEGNVKHTKNY